MPATPAAAAPASPVNYVLVDFENVHHVDPFDQKPVSIILLVGPKQNKLETGLVEKLFEHAASVKLVRLSSSGKNALDLTLVYYLGRAVVLDPAGRFHIISKDKDYDPLIAHLQSRNISIQRHADYTALTSSETPKPAAKTEASKAAPAARAPRKRASPPVTNAAGKDLFARVLEHLRQHPRNRPKQQKGLAPHLRSVCGKGSTEADVESLITRLLKGRHLSVNDKGAVSYSLE